MRSDHGQLALLLLVELAKHGGEEDLMDLRVARGKEEGAMMRHSSKACP